MIAFHCQTFPLHCLFWEWVLFKLGGEYRYRYRYEYIVEQSRYAASWTVSEYQVWCGCGYVVQSGIERNGIYLSLISMIRDMS